MPPSGKKRSRQSEDDGSKKKAKGVAAEEQPASSATKTKSLSTPATPSLAAATGASPAPRSFPRRTLDLFKFGSASKEAPKEEMKQDTLGNPYEQSRTATTAAPPIANTKKKPELTKVVNKKASTPPSPLVETSKKETSFTATNGSVAVKASTTRRIRNPTSVPCILLFLVAILMWCTVTLLGLLLSERMDHELQVWNLRDLLHKSEAVGVPPEPELVKHWKERAEQLESQKKGILKEFGEKLVNLDYME